MDSTHQNIQAGDRVKVTVSTEKRDPWLTPKEGWEGLAVAPALNMEATHWQIKFAEPWCSLGITRIMPLASLQVIGGAKYETERLEEQDVLADEKAPDNHEPFAEELVETEDGESPEEGVLFYEVSVSELDEDAPNNEEKIEVENPVKNTGFATGDLVMVKKNAGANSDEQHLIRRQGQAGRIIRNCEIATACVEVDFEDGKLPVLVPKSLLQSVNKTHRDAKSDTPLNDHPVLKKQMKLPF